MSEFTTPPTDSPNATAVHPTQESLYSQAFIYGMCALPIAAGILIGAFKYLSPDVASTLAASALSLLLGGPNGFFFGAAKHPTGPTGTSTPTTTTTTATPPTVTTTTGAQP